MRTLDLAAFLASNPAATSLPCHFVDMSSQLERSDSEKTMILGQEGRDTTLGSQDPAEQRPAEQDPASQHPAPQDPAAQLDAPVDPADFAPSGSEEDPDEPTYRVLDVYGHRIIVEGEVSPMALLRVNMLAQQLQASGHQGMGSSATSSSLNRGRSSMDTLLLRQSPSQRVRPRLDAKGAKSHVMDRESYKFDRRNRPWRKTLDERFALGLRSTVALLVFLPPANMDPAQCGKR